jgi:hypothetical protein
MDADDLIHRLEKLALEISAKQRELADLEGRRAQIRARIRALSAAAPGAMEQQPLPVLPVVSSKGKPTAGEIYVARLVRECRSTVGREWLRAKLGCSLDAASIKLARAAAKGLLVRVQRGLYVAPFLPDQEEYATVAVGEEPSSGIPRVPFGAEEVPV